MCSTGRSAAKRAANAQADAAKQTMEFAKQDWDYKQPFREQYNQYNAALDPVRSGFMAYLSGKPVTLSPSVGGTPGALVGGSANPNPYLEQTQGFNPASFLTTPGAAPTLRSRTGTDYASMLPGVGELDMGSVPLSYTPDTALLATFDDTPDWRSVGDRLEASLLDAYDIDLGRERSRVTNAINSDMLRRGLGTSSVAENAGIGLDNWSRRQRSLASADALTKRLAGEAAIRDELRASALSKAGLERAAAQDELSRFATAEELARMRRGEIANRASMLRDWDLGDTAFDNDVTTSQSALDAAIREEQRRNLWEALAWLQGDMDRVRAMGDTAGTMNSMIGATNSIGNAASNLAQIAANNGSIWGSLLSAAGMLGGAYLSRPVTNIMTGGS